MYSKKIVRNQYIVLIDLEELEGKEFLVLTGQYSIEIFSCFLRLLPLHSSTFLDISLVNSQIRSEDNLLIFRIQSLHLLLGVELVVTSNTGPILVFLRIQLFASDDVFISWQSVLTTCLWYCELWELFSVLCHEVLSDLQLLSGIPHQYTF